MNPKVIVGLLGKILANIIKMALTEKMMMRLGEMYVKMTKNKWDDHIFAIVKAGHTSDEAKLLKAVEELAEEIKASLEKDSK